MGKRQITTNKIIPTDKVDKIDKCHLVPLRIGDIQQTSKIKGYGNLDYYKCLKHLGLFSLKAFKRCIIIHVWKILNGLTPNDLDLSFSDSKRLGTKANILPYQRTV